MEIEMNIELTKRQIILLAKDKLDNIDKNKSEFLVDYKDQLESLDFIMTLLKKKINQFKPI